jgi:DNA-directed RNA polymerase specialized sigma24 family protein
MDRPIHAVAVPYHTHCAGTLGFNSLSGRRVANPTALFKKLVVEKSSTLGPMSSERSVTRWLRQLQAGNEDAASQLWRRYFRRLTLLARRRLEPKDCRVSDEEDIAVSVFRCLCDGARRGQFDEMANRDELWQLLVTMTNHKAVDVARHQKQKKRGSGRVRGESALNHAGAAGLDQMVSDEPSPEFLAMVAEEHHRLMSLLDDDCLRQTVLWKLEGYKNEEIAARLGVTCRSVERKLQRVRRIWSREFGS